MSSAGEVATPQSSEPRVNTAPPLRNQPRQPELRAEDHAPHAPPAELILDPVLSREHGAGRNLKGAHQQTSASRASRYHLPEAFSQ
jgi:hypothetical protein